MRNFFLLTLLFLSAPAWGSEPAALPRVLIGLYDSREESSPATTLLHRFVEMPANHLGYDIHYYDINEKLPVPGADVAGAVIWFDTGSKVPDADAYLDWLGALTKTGKKLVVFENLGIGDKEREMPKIAKKLSPIFAALGIRDDNRWHKITYKARITQQDNMVGFERKYGPTLLPFGSTHAVPGQAKSHLRVDSGEGDEPSDLVITSAGGGYVAEGYAIYAQLPDDPHVIQWLVNPFAFLQAALDKPFAPVPDVTTLDGLRIFYSHIDGDGWNNISGVSKYSKEHIIAAEVIRREILEPYRDFAFNVAAITADLDKNCYGLEGSEAVARAIYALPNVEPSTHTHTHPLFWKFFEHYSADHYSADKEKPYLSLYPPKPLSTASMTGAIKAKIEDDFATVDALAPPPDNTPEKVGRNDESEKTILTKYYTTPRSYACKAFNLDKEISGSANEINALLPEGKRVSLLQWSGDTMPFEAALAKTREAGLYNINGGDSRFDSEYPSYAWLAPIGLKIGDERQIYSSNSNENTYTNLWTSRFFGFRYLKRTVENTETPMRVMPFNMYFHMYSGEKDASLDALKANLDYARSLNLIHITATEFAAIAQGFYTAKITPEGVNRWKIDNLGRLATLRLDGADAYDIDFTQSDGVMGARHFQGNLYVALDPAAASATIALMDKDKASYVRPSLIQSGWIIKNLRISKNALTFQAQGYGKALMAWQVAPSAAYDVKLEQAGKVIFSGTFTADAKGNLALDFAKAEAIEPVNVTLELK